MTRESSPRLAVEPHRLTVQWPDGRAHEFTSLWLLDNRPEARDAHSGQRLLDVMDLPPAPRIRQATVLGSDLCIEWEDQSTKATISLAWLAAHAPQSPHSRPEMTRRHWLEGQALGASDFARASLALIRDDDAKRLEWLVRMLQDGIAFLSDVPCTEDGILETMQLTGQVMQTNYGQVFDVRSVAQPENLAYSDLGLGLHTDNPYREPVPGFQTLHALLASEAGGDSLFADGCALAEHFRTQDPDSFDILTRTPVPFAYRSEHADLYAERPLIQLACDGAILAVHYNNRSIAPLKLGARDAERFYAAYRRFAALLRESRYQFKSRLRNGELVMFDNQRILHGRTRFSSAQYPRHLRGCYLSRDSVYSTAALLRRGLESKAIS